ncbi:uncharacterized protein DS421_2g36150 [Arachis hypogaea]|nr:uncharacterized protein DS421_2g36150 [Arachis hypogaea]
MRVPTREVSLKTTLAMAKKKKPSEYKERTSAILFSSFVSHSSIVYSERKGEASLNSQTHFYSVINLAICKLCI